MRLVGAQLSLSHARWEVCQRSVRPARPPPLSRRRAPGQEVDQIELAYGVLTKRPQQMRLDELDKLFIGHVSQNRTGRKRTRPHCTLARMERDSVRLLEVAAG